MITKANQFFRATIHPGAAELPVEGVLPALDSATAWLNTPPLTAASLRGNVVLIDYWTYTCINWLRTLPNTRAWAEKYKEHGLVVFGVHTPEFGFEHDLDAVTPSGDGCVECLELGDSWVHWRLCVSCGHVGCCDNSKNKHATRHFGATRHPIIMSYEPGESWGWCFVEQGYFELLPAVLEQMGKPVPLVR